MRPETTLAIIELFGTAVSPSKMVLQPVLVPVARARDPLVGTGCRVLDDGVTELWFIDLWIGSGTIFVHDAIEGKGRKLNVLRLLDTLRRSLVERAVAIHPTT